MLLHSNVCVDPPKADGEEHKRDDVDRANRFHLRMGKLIALPFLLLPSMTPTVATLDLAHTSQADVEEGRIRRRRDPLG